MSYIWRDGVRLTIQLEDLPAVLLDPNPDSVRLLDPDSDPDE